MSETRIETRETVADETDTATSIESAQIDDPRLVIVSQHFPPDNSGNASRVRDTCQQLIGEEWDVTVLTPPPAFPHGKHQRTWKRETVDEREGVTVHRLWAWQPTSEDPGFGSRVAYYLLFPLHALVWLLAHRDRYDVVVTSSPPIFTGIAALPLGLLGLKPWLVDVRDLWIDASIGLGFVPEGGFVERMSRRYQRLVLQTADRVAVTTEQLGARLVAQYDVDEEKLLHLPNGVETERFDTTPETTSSRIVYTGNIGHAQDLESCIRALTYLDDTEAEMQIVGGGDVRSELETLVRDLCLEDRVEFTGVVPRTEVPAILDDAAIGIAPLKNQSTLEYAVPTKAYEYMAASTPVVATGSGEIEQLIDASSGGYVVANDPEALAETYERLLSDADLRAEIGRNGSEHIRTHYHRGSIARRLSRVLESLIESESGVGR